MSVYLLLLAVCISTEALLTFRPAKCVGLISGITFCGGMFLAFLCVPAPWVSAVYVICCLILCVVKFNVLKVFPVFGALIIAIILIATPGMEDLLYLDCRYSDHFTYVDSNICHSSILGCNVIVDLDKGDTYQSVLYEKTAVASCAAKLPIGSEIVYAYLERQPTKYLAASFEDYVRVVNPTVHIGAKLPERDYEDIVFPIHCVLETLS